MGWPEYALLALVVLNAGFFAAKHGETRTYNFWAFVFLDTPLLLFLLWKGGFFL